MEKMKLYIASSVGELAKKGNYEYDSNRSVKMHIKASETAFKAAEEARVKKDEERAYVLYMRYIDIYQKVKKSREFKKDADHFGLLLGTKKVTDALNHAEVLCEGLRKRYEEAKNSTKSTQNDDSLNHEKSNGVIQPINVNDSGKVEPEPAFSAPAAKPVISKDARSISCAILRKIQFSNSVQDYKVLLIDVRSESRFEESHVRHADCINVPARLLTPGTICNRIEEGIKNSEHLRLWKKRAEYDLLVMLDWFCEEDDLDDQKNPLRNLFDALHKWEQTIFLRHAPVVLSGGYSDWVEFYPQLTTNPKVEIPKKGTPGVISIETLSDVDFSSLLTPIKSNDEHENQPTLNSHGAITTNSNGLGEANNFDVTDGIRSVKSMSPTHQPVSDIFSNWKISNASSVIANTTFGKGENVPEQPKIVKPTGLEHKKSIPAVDRGTKPVSQNQPKNDTAAKAKDNFWESAFSLEISHGQNKSELTSLDSTTSPSSNSKQADDKNFLSTGSSVSDSAIAEMQKRMDEARKKKEDDEMKRKQLEEKIEVAEMEQELKRLEKEAEEEEKRRKKAEQDLAMKMRGLRPSPDMGAGRSENSSTKDVTSRYPVMQKPDAEKPFNSQNNEAASVDETQSKIATEPTPKSLNDNKPLKGGRSLPELPVTTDVPGGSSGYKTLDSGSVHHPSKGVNSTENKINGAITSDVPAASRTTLDTPSEVQGLSSIATTSAAHQPPITIPSRDTKPIVAVSQAPAKVLETSIGKPKSIRTDSPLPNREKKPNSNTVSQPTAKPSRQLPTPRPSKTSPQDPKLPKPSDAKSSGTQDKTKLTTSTNLPLNWEKRLDTKTGRYFYLDHNSHTTHWTLPSNVPVSRPKKTVQLKDEPSSTSGGLKRSSSTPNIAQLTQESLKPSQPSVNRQSKPKFEKQDLSDPPDVYANNIAQLHPNYGARGPGQCGLYNLGNTCYMNSVLQCMFSTALLAEYFIPNTYKLHLNRENFLGSGGEITDGFAVLMKAVWNGQYKNVTPRIFRNTIGRFNSRFSSYSQQDSQELLLFLMDGLHEDLNKIKKREYKEEEDNEGKPDPDAAKAAWDFHKRLNASIIVELFQGQFKAVTQCLHCRKTSRKFDVFMYLSLPLLSGGSCSILDCLAKFSEAEKLSGDNKWFCPSCKQERDAIRKIEIWKLPHVLLIHLKRFSFSGRWGDKLQTNVKFPSTNLNINKYVEGPRSNLSFNLYAVSHHYGATMDSGHYVASCKNPVDGNWYKYDDHEVSKTSIPSGSSAYILCYTSLKHELNLVTA